jgi:threonine dehydratase
MLAETKLLTLDEIKATANRLKGIIEATPTIKSQNLSNNEQEIFLKCENLQRTGSFKIRGAFNKLANLTNEEKAKGVIASSAGNHAQGVALSAQLMGIKSVICMPATAPQTKVTNTKNYGAEVVLNGQVYDDAYNKAIELQKEFGYTFVHPFDDERVIAGQATIALEILRDIDNVDAIVVPVGGGGLLSGIAIAAKALKPNIKIYGVQTVSVPACALSFKNGKLQPLGDCPPTLADGIAVKKPGGKTFEILQKMMDDIVIVTEKEIMDAVYFLIEKQHIVSEGAGAVSTAAVLSRKLPIHKRTVLVVSGGNIDMSRVSLIMDEEIKRTIAGIKSV